MVTAPAIESARSTNSGQTEQIGAATLESLARATRQVALYGPDHPITETLLAQACRELERAAGGEVLEIRSRVEGLLLNGELLRTHAGNAQRFYSGMRDRFITFIGIEPKVRPHDLTRLLMLLTEDPEEIAAKGGALAAFGSNGETTIHLLEFDFTAEMLVPEATWRQLCQGVNPEEAGNLRQLISSCTERIAAESAPETGHGSVLLLPSELDQQKGTAEEVVASGITQLIQRAGEALYFGDEDKWEKWRDVTVKQLATLPSRWRSLIFRAPSCYTLEYPDMLALIAARMDPADCVSLVLDHSDSIQTERSDMLRLALERILAARDRTEIIEVALHEKALEQGVPEAVYQNVVGLIVSRIEGQQPSEPEEALLQPKMAGPHRSPEAAKQDISDLLRTTDPDTVRRSRLSLLEESLENGLTISQYGTVVSLLTKAAEECASRCDLDGLIDVLGALGREAGGASGQSPSRRAVATSALTRTSTDQVASCLQSALPEASRREAEEIISLLSLLGEPGMGALVDILRAGDESLLSLAMTMLLKADGSDCSHLSDLISSSRGINLERVLRSLIKVIPEGEALRIPSALVDSSEEARQRTLELITEMGRRDLGRAVIGMLQDVSGAVRLAAVVAVGELRLTEAARGICELVRQEGSYGEGSRLKEAAVRALALIGAEAAVPTLCEVLRGGAFLSRLGSFRPRVAAAEALAVLGGPLSLDALRKGSRSMHPAIREACRKALARVSADHRQAEVESHG